MHEGCIEFIMFSNFSQIKRNNDRQSNQLSVTFRLKLDCPSIQDKKQNLIHH